MGSATWILLFTLPLACIGIAKKACENVCSFDLPKSAPCEAVEITTKEVTKSYPCMRGFCPTPHTHLVGYLHDSDYPVTVDGHVTCGSDQLWADNHNNHFQYVACVYKARSGCPTSVPSYGSSTLAGKYLGKTTAIRTVKSRAGLKVGTCGSTGDRMIAFTDESSLPVFVESLSCTENGWWRDINDNIYEAAGCYTDAKCGICDQSFDFDGFMPAQYYDYSTDANNCPIPDMCIDHQLIGYNTTDGVNIVTTLGRALIQCPPGSNQWLVYTDPKLQTPLHYDLLGCLASCPSLKLEKSPNPQWYITQLFTETGYEFTCPGEAGMDVNNQGTSRNHHLWCDGTKWFDENNVAFDVTKGIGCKAGAASNRCQLGPPAGATVPNGAKNAKADPSLTMATCDIGYNMMGFKYQFNGNGKASSTYEFIVPGTQSVGCVQFVDQTFLWVFRSTNCGYTNLFCIPAK